MSPHLAGARDFPQKALQSPAHDRLPAPGHRLARSRSPPGPAPRLAPPRVPGTSGRGWGGGGRTGGSPATVPQALSPTVRPAEYGPTRLAGRCPHTSRATSYRSGEEERAGARQPRDRGSAAAPSPGPPRTGTPARPAAGPARSRRGEDWALERGQERRRAGHAVAAATDTARGRATCSAARAPQRGAATPPYLAAGRAPADADQEGLAAVGLLVVLQGLLAVPGHGWRRPSSRCCGPTHAPRPRPRRAPPLPAAAAGRCPAACEPPGARPWGCLSRRRRQPASARSGRLGLQPRRRSA